MLHGSGPKSIGVQRRRQLVVGERNIITAEWQRVLKTREVEDGICALLMDAALDDSPCPLNLAEIIFRGRQDLSARVRQFWGKAIAKSILLPTRFSIPMPAPHNSLLCPPIVTIHLRCPLRYRLPPRRLLQAPCWRY